MVIISKYRLVNKKKFYKIDSYESISCPICGGELKCIGSRIRRYYDERGDLIVLSLRRLRCTSCLKIHHEIPDFIIPYHLLCKAIFLKIIKNDYESCPVNELMVYRVLKWWNMFKNYTSCNDSIEIKDMVNEGKIKNSMFLISQNYLFV